MRPFVPRVGRRAFLRTGLAATAAALVLPRAALAASDTPRHVLFEYYPWYRSDPWVHWDQDSRTPPDDVGSNYMPQLGAYDSTDRRVIEQHARWIADAGATGINLSWWGPGSLEDQAVPIVMDVMRDHGLKVAFHLEPYSEGRGTRYAEDVLYLIREYGDRRHWDAFLLLATADGRLGPVFKSFATILPPTSTDCRGVTREVAGYVADEAWRAETDAVRDALRRDFDQVLLLADSLELARTPRSGFDGIAIYDPFVDPEDWMTIARDASSRGLLSTFGVNAGFDGLSPRRIDPEACGGPPHFEPAAKRGEPQWKRESGREQAAALAAARIEESWRAAVKVQREPSLLNAQRGLDLVYVVSFNEWHEGTAFEPMRDAAALTPAEAVHGYHNPAHGAYRLELLKQLIRG